MEEAAGVLSKEERLILLRLLKKTGKRAGKMNLSGTVIIGSHWAAGRYNAGRGSVSAP